MLNVFALVFCFVICKCLFLSICLRRNELVGTAGILTLHLEEEIESPTQISPLSTKRYLLDIYLKIFIISNIRFMYTMHVHLYICNYLLFFRVSSQNSHRSLPEIPPPSVPRQDSGDTASGLYATVGANQRKLLHSFIITIIFIHQKMNHSIDRSIRAKLTNNCSEIGSSL